MSLTAAIITIVGLDLAVLAVLAYVMRAPFRLAEHVQGRAAAAERPHSAPRPRSVPSRRRSQPVAGAVR